MYRYLWFLTLCYTNTAVAILCFNCSSTQKSWNNYCAGDFAFPRNPFNSSRKYVLNCTGENAMCFVRSWLSRDRHAWLVQRGCYQNSNDDILQSLRTPTRSMSCRKDRLPNAESTLCLCTANWCNVATVKNTGVLFKYIFVLLVPLLFTYSYYYCY